MDVDDNKIARGYYDYHIGTRMTKHNVTTATTETAATDNRKERARKIPIVHFALAVKDPIVREQLYNTWKFQANIDNSEDVSCRPFFGHVNKKQKPYVASVAALMNDPPFPVPTKTTKLSAMERNDPGVGSLDIEILKNNAQVANINNHISISTLKNF